MHTETATGSLHAYHANGIAFCKTGRTEKDHFKSDCADKTAKGSLYNTMQTETGSLYDRLCRQKQDHYDQTSETDNNLWSL